MSSNQQRENEVKFYLRDPQAFQTKVETAGGRIGKARGHEYNLRFDTPERELSRAHRVLRLRRDEGVQLTYKGPSETGSGVTSRQEFEIDVSDFEGAQRFLEALGYGVSVIYEKYRTSYRLNQVLVTIDEMPFGTFSEIEGQDAAAIRDAAQQLGLAWERRLLQSYLAIFAQLKRAMKLTFRDLTFENFEGVVVPPEMIKGLSEN